MLIGISLALAATLGYTFNSLFLALLKEKAGTVSTKYMFLVALTSNLFLHLLVYKSVYPVYLQARQFLLLGISAILGMLLGFILLIKAIQLIGPRLVLLVITSTTIFNFLLGWIYLQEKQSVHSFFYITMIIGGIVVTLLYTDRPGSVEHTIADGPPPSRPMLKGILLTVLLALFQAVSQLLSKIVLLEDIPPLSVSTVRLSIAAGCLWLFTLLFRNTGGITYKSFLRWDWMLIVLAALVGPVVSVLLNFNALKFINLGISAAMLQLSPVFMLFIARIVFKERIRFAAVLGTALAVLGTILLAIS